MFKPKLSDSNQTLSFKVRGIGKKNKDLLTGLRNEQLSDTSLFIDASGPACLSNCAGADLSFAILNGAHLYYSNFEGADLSFASLYGARIDHSNLNGANLYNANLTDADLWWADLNDARLNDANLTDADLTGADLTDATWKETICPDGTVNNGTSPCTAEQLNLA